jgi:hypothetical protein
LQGRHIVPFVPKDDKQVRPVLLVQVIPLVLLRKEKPLPALAVISAELRYSPEGNREVLLA